MRIKVGTKVKVVDNKSDHRFVIGSIVTRTYGPLDDEFGLAFADGNSLRYMAYCDYVVIEEPDNKYKVEILVQALLDIINKEVQSSPDATDFAESMDKGLVIAAIKGIARKALEDIK